MISKVTLSSQEEVIFEKKNSGIGCHPESYKEFPGMQVVQLFVFQQTISYICNK